MDISYKKYRIKDAIATLSFSDKMISIFLEYNGEKFEKKIEDPIHSQQSNYGELLLGLAKSFILRKDDVYPHKNYPEEFEKFYAEFPKYNPIEIT